MAMRGHQEPLEDDLMLSGKVQERHVSAQVGDKVIEAAYCR